MKFSKISQGGIFPVWRFLVDELKQGVEEAWASWQKTNLNTSKNVLFVLSVCYDLTHQTFNNRALRSNQTMIQNWHIFKCVIKDHIISCLSPVIHQSSAVVCSYAVWTDQKVPETRQEGIKAALLLANPQRTICKITEKTLNKRGLATTLFPPKWRRH